ncbi:DHHA1 domain-containing protein [Bacillaceae bacterium S4-13-58]
MQTEKLYYQDQYIKTFTTTILKQSQDENGKTYVVLDQTYFYPTGGGQPHDTGKINDVPVYDVEEVDGEIRHYIEGSLELQNQCEAEIDWERRFDHMQQHTGQHILSAAFDNMYEYKTVSFHLGKEICSIDIDTESLREEGAARVEKAANQIILENRPIKTKWVTADELSQYTLRKKVAVSENIRLVIIPEFDYNGCGGTHPKETGQVSSIKILYWEKQKKQIRVYFVCGNRVLKELHQKHEVIQDLTSKLSVPQEQLGGAVNRVLQQTKELERQVDALKLELLEFDAEKLIANAETHNNINLIKIVFKDRSIQELQQLARTISTKSENGLILFVTDNGTKLQLICATGSEVAINCNQLIKGILPIINGKGGGNDSFAQGGGENILPAEKVMEEFLRLVKEGEKQ